LRTISLDTDPLASIRIPEYRNYILGRFFFIMGLRMLGTLVGWWLYELTRDPLAMGLIGLSEVVPAVSLALYAGHIIDRSDRRKLLVTGVVLYWLCALVLLLISTSMFSRQFGKSAVIFLIYFVVFCTGAIRAFTGPTFSAIISQIVPREILPNATTWNQGTWLTASVMGHATAGFLIAAVEPTGTLVAVMALVSTAFFVLSRIRPKPPHASAFEKRTWESVKEGLRFVYRTKELLGALTLDLFAVLFGGAVAMVPVYAKDVLHITPIGFGWLNAAADIGSIMIVVLLTLFPLRHAQGRILLYAVGGFGVCIIVFGLSQLFWLSFAALLVSGIMDGVSVVVRGTILQLKTPNELRGRVMSVNSMFINSSNELGQFESGVAARLLGLVPSVVFGGCMTIAVVIGTWFKSPTLRKLNY